jgi:hypothetical protein
LDSCESFDGLGSLAVGESSDLAGGLPSEDSGDGQALSCLAIGLASGKSIAVLEAFEVGATANCELF